MLTPAGPATGDCRTQSQEDPSFRALRTPLRSCQLKVHFSSLRTPDGPPMPTHSCIADVGYEFLGYGGGSPHLVPGRPDRHLALRRRRLRICAARGLGGDLGEPASPVELAPGGRQVIPLPPRHEGIEVGPPIAACSASDSRSMRCGHVGLRGPTGRHVQLSCRGCRTRCLICWRRRLIRLYSRARCACKACR